ncbi:hypothetical protein ACWXWU_19895 [Shewanella sp. A14]
MKKIAFYFVVTAILTMVAIYSSPTYSYPSVNAINSVYCHNCDDIDYKNKAITRSKSLAFISDDYGEPEYTYVNVFDINNEAMKSYLVSRSESPFFPSLVYNAREVLPEPTIKSEWEALTSELNLIFSNPFISDENGMAFLSDEKTRNKVFNRLNNQWYGIILGASQTIRILDSVVGVFPNNAVYNRMKITFKDNVELIISIADVEQLTLGDLFTGNAVFVYVQDSAYIVDEDGYLVKLPDDMNEANTVRNVKFSGLNTANKFALFVGGLRSSGATNCSVVKTTVTDKDGSERVVYVYSCV